MNIAELKNFTWYLLPIIFLAGAVFAQQRYDAVWQEHFVLRAPIHRFIMPAQIVQKFTFGFDNIIADYYWVRAVQDINKWDRRDEYYPEYFRIISTLDARFLYPYVFAALTVPTKITPESLMWLEQISLRGISALPENWEIPFYTGLDFHSIGDSYERATHYLRIAAEIPASPLVAKNVYALFLLRSSTDNERSRALFQTVYDTADNEESKRIAMEHIALLDYIEAVDKASSVYKTSRGVYPASLEILTKAGLIISLPEEFSRFHIIINSDTGKASLE